MREENKRQFGATAKHAKQTKRRTKDIKAKAMAISEELMQAADEMLGIRLESAGGITTWEAHPVPLH